MKNWKRQTTNRIEGHFCFVVVFMCHSLHVAITHCVAHLLYIFWSAKHWPMLRHATRAFLGWLMGKQYSYIFTSMLYRTVQGSWLLVSLHDHAAKEKAKMWEQISMRNLMDGWIDERITIQVYNSHSSFILPFFFVWDISPHVSQTAAASFFFFSFLPSLSPFLYLSFLIFTLHLIPHSLPT